MTRRLQLSPIRLRLVGLVRRVRGLPTAAPVALLTVAIPLLTYAAHFRAGLGWNVIEFAIGRNLLRGEGYVDFVGAPPISWRPPLAAVAAGLVARLTGDPLLALRLLYVGGAGVATVAVYLVGKRFGSVKVGVLAGAIFVTSPAMLSSLVQASHGLSDLALIAAYPALMVAALHAFDSQSLRWYAIAGSLAGLCYLARFDGVLYAGAAGAWLALGLNRRWRLLSPQGTKFASRRHVGRGLIVYGVVAMAVASPWLTHLWRTTGEPTLNGQGIYVFYASEGWVYGLTGDVENLGYRQAVREYGSVADTGGNTARAILNNPGHFLDRLRRNGDLLRRVVVSDGVFPIVLVPFIFVGFVLARRHEYPALALVALSGLPVLAYLYSYPDPRYLTHAVPSMSLLAALGAAGAFACVRRLPRTTWSTAAATGGLLVVGWFWVTPTVDTWRHAEDRAALERDFAEATRAAVEPTRDDVLVTGGGPLFGPEVAYYLDVRYSWSVPQGPDDYPRTTIFSMRNYTADEITLWFVAAADRFRLDFGDSPPKLLAVAGDYIGLVRAPVPDAPSLSQLLLAGGEAIGPDTRMSAFDIHHDARPVLYMPPPGRAAARVSVPVGGRLVGALALDPAVWSTSDGVVFRIVVTDAGRDVVVYRRRVNPRARRDDRAWLAVDVDLGRFAGREIMLALETLPAGTPASDWSGWADLRIVAGGATAAVP